MSGFRTAFFVAAAIFGGTACSAETSSGGSPSNAAAGRSAFEGGSSSTDDRPRVVVVEPLRGASSVNPEQATIKVTVSCPRGGQCFEDPVATATLLAPRISLTDGGAEVPVVPERRSSSQPSNEYVLTFLPAAPLRADTRYALTISSDSSAVVGFPDANETEAAHAIAAAAPVSETIPLFTGSAPMLVSAVIANDPGKALMSIRIRMSEPVLLSSLFNSFELFAANGDRIPACAWDALGKRCADDTSARSTETLDLTFSSPVDVGALQGARIHLSGSVQGVTNTLAEGFRKKGEPLDSSAGIDIVLRSDWWSACSSKGDSLCIRDVEEP